MSQTQLGSTNIQFSTSSQILDSAMSEKPQDDIVRLPQETFRQSDAEIKKAAKELVFKKFSGLLKKLA